MSADEDSARTGRQQPAESIPAGAGNVDKIRDILFGSQMQDYDRRFDKLEKRVEKSVADLHEDVARRLAALEKYTKKEIETLLVRVAAEADSRTETDKELSRELADTGKKLRQLTDQTTAAQRDLHKEILDQSKSLRDEVREKSTALAADLAAAASELDAAKVARVELASHLVEVARRLSGESAPKSKAGSGESGNS